MNCEVWGLQWDPDPDLHAMASKIIRFPMEVQILI